MQVQWRLISLVILMLATSRSAWSAEVVKVFILAGQSNMQGHGEIEARTDRNKGRGSLQRLATDPETRDRFDQWLGVDGQWATRDDVQIWYLDRQGDLRPGFGAKEGLIGPELGFGQVVGDAFDEPVLLIKLAWGGKSLARDFRPPSAGGEVGPYYREVVDRSREVLHDIGSVFPRFAESRLELVGFGWHQGWNDRINSDFNDEYQANLAHLIRDLRRDLEVPDLPFVVAETGMNGPEESHPRALALMSAQAAVAEEDEFRGNVAFVGTRAYYRPPEASPARQGYHWNRNAETYFLIGEAMGQAMLELLEPSDEMP